MQTSAIESATNRVRAGDDPAPAVPGGSESPGAFELGAPTLAASPTAGPGGDENPTAFDTVALPDWVREPQRVELPAAPEPLATLIDAGNVAFDFYDPQREPFAFAGETRFTFHYTFRCQTHWQVIAGPAASDPGNGRGEEVIGGDTAVGRASSTRPRSRRASAARARRQAGVAESLPPPKEPSMLEVRTVYDEVKLTVSHRVRLPLRIAGPDFFDHPLVRHEFDHIAISADVGLQTRLRQMLAERNTVIHVPLDPQVPEVRAAVAAERAGDDEPLRQHYAAIAHAAVRRQSDRVFEEFIEAVAIRQRELDRVTSHGRHKLPAEERSRLIDSPGP